MAERLLKMKVRKAAVPTVWGAAGVAHVGTYRALNQWT